MDPAPKRRRKTYPFELSLIKLSQEVTPNGFQFTSLPKDATREEVEDALKRCREEVHYRDFLLAWNVRVVYVLPKGQNFTSRAWRACHSISPKRLRQKINGALKRNPHDQVVQVGVSRNKWDVVELVTGTDLRDWYDDDSIEAMHMIHTSKGIKILVQRRKSAVRPVAESKN